MKIAWIFPRNKLCGISFYSQTYVTALKEFVDVECLDAQDFLRERVDFLKKVNDCTIAHIQYETSFFLKDNKDFYPALCRSIHCPIFVTLHEVYDQFPGVFPRTSIKGKFLVKKLKEWIYDRRHPYITALTEHIYRNFFAQTILVHSNFQKEILIKKAIPGPIIKVLPVPVESKPRYQASPWNGEGTLFLATTGFISNSYDFDLLFRTLSRCTLSWKFTWIGSIRRPEDKWLLEKIHKEIESRNWQNRFTITGTVPNEQRDKLLAQTNIYCAFFNYKSSSESLAAAISSRTMIVATHLPLTIEMSKEYPIMITPQKEPYSMERAIQTLACDHHVQSGLKKALADYCNANGRQKQAKRLLDIYYKEIVA
jgi:glycosyltransferase involved in cell wall biosynthesis